MKKLLLIVIILSLAGEFVSAQTDYLPTLQAGIKGGGDYSILPAPSGFQNKEVPGYIAGVWGRLGGAGLFFQPELDIVTKNVTVIHKYSGYTLTDHAKFANFDVPLLVGEKVGNANYGLRFYTGPLLSYAIVKRQDFLGSNNDSNITYVDNNYSWVFGGGIDVKQFSLDFHYEAGINKVYYGSNPLYHTKFNVISLTLAYSVFSQY